MSDWALYWCLTTEAKFTSGLWVVYYVRLFGFEDTDACSHAAMQSCCVKWMIFIMIFYTRSSFRQGFEIITHTFWLKHPSALLHWSKYDKYALVQIIILIISHLLKMLISDWLIDCELIISTCAIKLLHKSIPACFVSCVSFSIRHAFFVDVLLINRKFHCSRLE